MARDLLGSTLCHRYGDMVLTGRIVETEAYLGPLDPASHSSHGRTPRTWNMFGPPGTAYVYLIYGRYWCLNAVTGPDGFGAAVLIRAVEPLKGIDIMRERRPLAKSDATLSNGPGKLSAAFGVTGELDGTLLTGSGPLTIYSGEPVPDAQVNITPRIGLTRAIEWPLRFVVRKEKAVSRSATKYPPRDRRP